MATEETEKNKKLIRKIEDDIHKCVKKAQQAIKVINTSQRAIFRIKIEIADLEKSIKSLK